MDDVKRIRKATDLPSSNGKVALAEQADRAVADAQDDMRHITVPDRAIATAYVHRDYHGVNDFDLFNYARGTKSNVLLYGPTGAGKTHAAMAYAAKHGLLYCNVPSHVSVTPDQLFGKYVPNDDGLGFHWEDGPVTTIVKRGGVLLLNEVNFMPDRVGTVIFGLLDRRREIILQDKDGEIVRADQNGSDLLIIADMNPDYSGTRPLNAAFRNRFAVQIDWDYDSKVEASLVRSGALLRLVNQLRKSAGRGEMETPVGTNMMIEFERAVEKIGYDIAVLLFANHFTSDERDTVRQVFATHEHNLKADLLPKPEPVAAEDGEEEDNNWSFVDEANKWVYKDQQ